MVERRYSPREVADLLTLGFSTRYMRRLLADREYIRAAMTNPGGSVILTGVSRDLQGADEYSSQLGNDYHLDLLQAELEITNNCLYCSDLPRFTAKQVATIMDWAASLSPDEAERSGLLTQKPGALRRARHHSIAKVTARMTRDG